MSKFWEKAEIFLCNESKLNKKKISMHVKRFNTTILNIPIKKEQLLRNMILKMH